MAPQNNTASQRSFRRLLWIIGLAAMLIIFAYGWTVTDIDLSVPQQPTRQINVGNALQELLSPNVFTQEYDVTVSTTTFTIGCPDGFTPPEVTPSAGPYIVVEPACANANELVTVNGYNFAGDQLARLNWIDLSGERRIRQVVGRDGDNFITRDDGTFSVQIEVPRIRGSAGQLHTIEAQGRVPSGPPQISQTTDLVIEKMLETIFLALIATTVSILPAAILSFFAAYNLMRNVRTPMGGLLLSVALLPVGFVLGTFLLGALGNVMLSVGTGGAAASAGLGGLIAFASVASARRMRASEPSDAANMGRAILNALIVAVVAIAVFGLLGAVGLLLGRVSQLGFFGTFIGSIGELIRLAMPLVAGIAGAFTLSSIGTALTRDALKTVSVNMSHVLGAILGALSGAVVLGVVAFLGTKAAWLGLLTPVFAAGLGGAILPQLYRRFVPKPLEPSHSDSLTMTVLGWLGSIVAFLITYSLLNVQRAVVEGALPSSRTAFTVAGLEVSSYLFEALLIGLVLGGLAGGLAGTRSNFPIGQVLYTGTRTLLNAIRSIEPLIMGLVFVIWVGIGPFAGVLALALHSVASLGKLYSEQVENIDTGPIEALQSTGANRLQTIMYAVVPQIIPPYIAFTMYRWDINVRMSTIIGFVGGGGIGFLLQQQINLLRYRDAGVAVLAIAIVVSVLDYASAFIRERYT